MKSKYHLLLIGMILMLTIGCKKYIDRKPNSNVQVPTNTVELWGLLDNQDIFGYGHTLGLMSADEFFISPSYYQEKLSTSEKNAYIWNPDIFDWAEIPHDWAKSYEQIFYANIALEGVKASVVDTSDDMDLKKITGDALFKRAHAHFQLSVLFALAFNAATADDELGIPLKLKTDPNESITRPSMRECYNQILSDLDEAEKLLPGKPDPSRHYRTSNAAILGLKARINLYMGNWQLSALAAEQALKHCDSLIDFNSIDTSAKNPFKTDTREIIYSLKAPDNGGENAWLVGLTGSTDAVNVDTGLIHSYLPQDLRLPIYFKQRGDKTWYLRFTLTGTRTPFEGISISEIYLTLAEAQARQGNTTAALDYLSKLVRNRYKTGQVPPLPNSNDVTAVLERVLDERQKELCYHGLRWMDIKRLNVQGRKITQERKINNMVYTIPPNDLRYALPLPASTVKKYKLDPNPR